MKRSIPSVWGVLAVSALWFTAACDSPIIREARRAEKSERVISNEMMAAMYPQAFKPGSPQYLERDFEAGANFICDQIKLRQGRDICADPEINWRK